MRLRRWTPATIAGQPTFETLRETVATVDAGAVRGGRVNQLLRAATLRCHRGGSFRTGTECLACSRIVMIRPGPDSATVEVRCLWTDDDRVSEVMTEIAAATTVTPTLRCDQADRVAAREGVHHLLVADAGEVIGAICRCELNDPGRDGETVASRMVAELWSVPPDATLGQAAEVMEQHGVSVLAVSAGPRLDGLLTRADLGLSEHGVALATPPAACDRCSSSSSS